MSLILFSLAGAAARVRTGRSVSVSAALEARVSCRRGQRVVVDGATLTAERGTLTAILGPNGAGKSSLLLAMAGLLPFDGELRLDGRDATRMSPRERARHLALVLQDPPTDMPFTVAELVLMGRSPHLGRLAIEGAEDRRIAREAMRSVDVDHLAERPIDQLSGGEKRRVFLARALAQQPKILLLDEPTAFLDLGHQAQLLAHCRELAAGGLCILAVLHDPNLAAAYADRVVLMQQGRIVEQGAPTSVLTAARLEALYGAPLLEWRGQSGEGPYFAPPRS